MLTDFLRPGPGLYGSQPQRGENDNIENEYSCLAQVHDEDDADVVASRQQI